MNWTDPIIIDGVSYQFEHLEDLDDPLLLVMKINKHYQYELYRDINADEPKERWYLRYLYTKVIGGVASPEWFNYGNVYYGKEIKSPEFIKMLLEHILELTK